MTNRSKAVAGLQDPDDIKRWRKRLGLTQAELAVRAGMKPSALAAIEAKSGTVTLTKERANALWTQIAERQLELRLDQPIEEMLEGVQSTEQQLGFLALALDRTEDRVRAIKTRMAILWRMYEVEKQRAAEESKRATNLLAVMTTEQDVKYMLGLWDSLELAKSSRSLTKLESEVLKRIEDADWMLDKESDYDSWSKLARQFMAEIKALWEGNSDRKEDPSAPAIAQQGAER